ncbi:hypothetical protein DL762_010377 [Monosporascus cannonballus]|uniref:Carrier domain-containing protein n=1 Tax=Monosporascus cannonballus TaxID=155416 RepID=A0ABY0GU92_9PEZI|nr:hypothetical protein DL762_010377 [Monosporascus cannonballus]
MTGLLRTIKNENENINVTWFDLPDDYAVKDASKEILSMISQAYSGDEVALRDGLLRIPRIEIDERRNQKLPNCGNIQARLKPFHQGDRRLTLKIGKVGLLDMLAFKDDEEVADPELRHDQVEVEVRASALNFRDIAASMGLIEDYCLGDEVAGVVLRTGRDVQESELKPGDRVLVTRPGQGGHRSVVRETAMLYYRIGNIDYAEAVALCGVYCTAYFSLVSTARLKAGEYWLIHSAAGGVGQIAIQIAQYLGAKIIATVGSAEKRQFLQERFGIPENMIRSSRDPLFVKGIRDITNGYGIDVALNSLAGELFHETWRNIAPFGRFVKIGKRNIHENTKLDMDPFRNNVTPPQPLTRMSFAEVQKAFRLLQMGKHFGKIVLVPGEHDMVPVLLPSYRNTKLFASEKVYLLVGGLGGMGSPWQAGWYAGATLFWLKAKGIAVKVFRGDVTDKETVNHVIQSLGDRLAGIFQAVMENHDGLYAQMTMDQWRECASPKTHGTWNLHNATLNNSRLDFFVCLSSSSGILGAMGQANYAAANCYMDALMAHRRAMGLPGFTMNLGMVSGVGAVSNDATLETTMERLGYEPMAEKEAFYPTEEAVLASYAHKERQKTTYLQQQDFPYTGSESHRLVAGINVQRKDVYWATLPVGRNLYANLDLGDQGDKPKASQNLATVIQMAQTHDEKAENPLVNYGLDSIVAVEFRKWFLKTVQVDVALFQIIGAKSITALVETVVGSVMAAHPSSSEGTGGQLTLSAAESKIAQAATLAQKLDNGNSVSSVGSKISKEEFPVIEDKSAPIPLSSAQIGLWRAHNMLEDPSALNLTITCFISGNVLFQTMKQAVVELACRNPIFRTAYMETVVRYEDDSGNVESSPRALAEWYSESMKRVALDSRRGEVMHVTVLKLGAGHYAMAFAVHHIALDNMSTTSKVNQMISLYDALRFGTQADLARVPSPRLTYADYTLWMQRQVHGSGSLPADLEWWAANLHGIPAASSLLPFATGPRPAERFSTHRDVVHNVLPKPLSRRIRRVAAPATPFHFLLTALRGFIYRYIRENDLVLLLVDNMRPHAALDDVIGYFVNLVPLRCRGGCDGPDATFDSLLGRVSAGVLEAMAHSWAPFGEVARAAGADPAGCRSHFPVGQLVVNYMPSSPAPRFAGREFRIDELCSADMAGTCELAVDLAERHDDTLGMRLEFDCDLYPRRHMERFWNNFLIFLTQVIRDPRMPLAEVKI